MRDGKNQRAMPNILQRRRWRLATAAAAVAASAFVLDVRAQRPLELYVRPAAGAVQLISDISAGTAQPIGCEVSGDPMLDRTELAVLPARTARQALADWARLDPRYEWRDVDGVPVIRPQQAWSDRGDLLNRRVGPIEWRDVTMLQFLLRVAALMGQRLDDDSVEQYRKRRFSVTVRSGRVIDVLNGAARNAGTFSWVVEVTPSRVTATAIVYEREDGRRDAPPERISIGVLR